MLSTRLFPLAPFDGLRNEMDRFLDVFHDGTPAPLLPRLNRIPAINAWDDDDHVYVEVEAPGIPMDKLDIEVLGRDLTISGTREETKRDDSAYQWRERSFGSFSRSIRLNVDIDADNVKAVLKDGVLTVTLPKAVSAKSRRISVTTE